MYRWLSVPMIALLFLSGCGGSGEQKDLRRPYRELTACTMEATVSCEQEGAIWEADLRCEYVPEGKTTVEVLSPESIAGVRAVLDGLTWQLEYEDVCLNAGMLGPEKVSPAACLPRLLSALREGWLLEENEETWNEIPCYRLLLDQTGPEGGKILSTIWLKAEDGMPLRGEISTDGEIILTAEFTEFAFCDTINIQENP